MISGCLERGGSGLEWICGGTGGTGDERSRQD
jgi:hypothetical protein